MKNTIFAKKTFVDCSLLAPKDVTPQNFAEKTFANNHKTAKFPKVFSLESFPLYSILCFSILGHGSPNTDTAHSGWVRPSAERTAVCRQLLWLWNLLHVTARIKVSERWCVWTHPLSWLLENPRLNKNRKWKCHKDRLSEWRLQGTYSSTCCEGACNCRGFWTIWQVASAKDAG